jgi:hypothetical protein
MAAKLSPLAGHVKHQRALEYGVLGIGRDQAGCIVFAKS